MCQLVEVFSKCGIIKEVKHPLCIFYLFLNGLNCATCSAYFLFLFFFSSLSQLEVLSNIKCEGGKMMEIILLCS